MNETEVRETFFRVLRGIAPDVDPASLDPNGNLRTQADLDSVDVMNLVVALHEELGVDIPETDYDELETVEGAVGYLAGRIETGSARSSGGGEAASPGRSAEPSAGSPPDGGSG